MPYVNAKLAVVGVLGTGGVPKVDIPDNISCVLLKKRRIPPPFCVKKLMGLF
jgi:hypothetical protein